SETRIPPVLLSFFIRAHWPGAVARVQILFDIPYYFLQQSSDIKSSVPAKTMECVHNLDQTTRVSLFQFPYQHGHDPVRLSSYLTQRRHRCGSNGSVRIVSGQYERGNSNLRLCVSSKHHLKGRTLWEGKPLAECIGRTPSYESVPV